MLATKSLCGQTVPFLRFAVIVVPSDGAPTMTGAFVFTTEASYSCF